MQSMKSDRNSIIKKAMLLYAVTDRRWCIEQTLQEQIELAIKGGITALQLREKDLKYDEFLKEALEVKELCKNANIPLFINDSVEIAYKSGADGVHIGQDDMSVQEARKILGSNAIIGVSVHNIEECKNAIKNGADYLGVGAVFSTSTKTDVGVLSLEMLREICAISNVPVVAIGGITSDNILSLANTGLNGVAVVSSIFAARDIEKMTRELLEKARKIAN